MSIAQDHTNGILQLLTEAEQREAEHYYAELDARQQAEFDARFADYTEQQYLAEQVYQPKQ
jgi:hypothetical protein